MYVYKYIFKKKTLKNTHKKKQQLWDIFEKGACQNHSSELIKNHKHENITVYLEKQVP